MIQPVELRRFSGAGGDGFSKRGARKKRGGGRVVREAVEQLPGRTRDAGYGAGPSSNAADKPVDVARWRKLQAHGGRVSDHVARTGQVPGYERVHVCRRTNYTISLFTTLRDRVHLPLGPPPSPPSTGRPPLNALFPPQATGTVAFTEASGKLAALLLNEAIALLPFTPTSVVTPVRFSRILFRV